MEKLTFILDVDGIFSDGTFYYTKEGKIAKKYGPDDNEALKLIQDKINIIIMSGDNRAFEITKKRVNDMGFELLNVGGGKTRLEWIKQHYDLNNVIYMGDGLKDAFVLKNVMCGICTSTSSFLSKKYSNYITTCSGGERAVAEAVFYIAEKFLNITPEELIGLE